MWIHEAHRNKTENHLISDEIEYEAFTDDIGKLFRSLQNEYGRCVSKVYRDKKIVTNDHGGERWEVVSIGWVFEKRERYQDMDETYLHETWITLMDGPTNRVVIEKPSYVELPV